MVYSNGTAMCGPTIAVAVSDIISPVIINMAWGIATVISVRGD